MNESILRALMQLFAIIANVEDHKVSEKAREIVISFLKNHLPSDLVAEYLQLFDRELDRFHGDGFPPESDKTQKKVSANSVKALKIGQEINKELHRREKYIVLMRLIEFVNEDEIITEGEYEFVRTVANVFSISHEEFENLQSFLLDETEKIERQNCLLFIDSKDPYEAEGGSWFARNRPNRESESKHLLNENLKGKIVVLFVESLQIFVFKYLGDEDLYLNGQNIVPENSYLLEHGSIIKSQRISPVYYSDVAGQFLQSKSSTRIVFSARDVAFRFKNSNNGIKPFSFSEESGQFIGIMGGSGVGKSTLFNLLSGQYFPSGGKVTINGHDIHREHHKIEGVIGFVPQDDLLIEELTVFQNLYYNAKLCFGNFSQQQILEAVVRVLKDLELYDVKDLKVGSPLSKLISGGQRKRLNIALELIREPTVLFVDEPTSGLSSMDSENVMLLLKQQTLKGKLVIANIHQPSSNIFKLFDKLWVLDKGGYPIYNGNPIDAVVYFKTMANYVNASESECPVCGNVNPEQILQIVEAKMVDEAGKFTEKRKIPPKEWYQLYKKNIESEVEEKPSDEKIPKNFFKTPDLDKQFGIFSIRNFLSKLANKQYIFLTLLEAPLLAFVLAYLTKYYQGETYIFSANKNLPAFLFMSVIVALFLGLILSAEEIIRDRKILKRESFLNLSWFSYLNSKVLYLFGLSALQMFLYVLVGTFILEIQGMVFTYWLVLFSASCFANMVGLNISSGLKSVVAIYVLIPFILVPQILLSGVIVPFDDLHKHFTNKIYVPFVGEAMASRWAYEALAVEQFKSNAYERIFYQYDKQISDATYRYSYVIPNLQTKLDECLRSMKQGKNKDQTLKNFAILRNEMRKLWQFADEIPFGGINEISPSGFNADVAEEAQDYLLYLKLHYSESQQKASRERDFLIRQLIQTMGKDGLMRLKENHHNKRLANWVKNTQEMHKIYETDEQLIQKKDPIFMYPDSRVGRSHFYAPVKNINGRYFDSLWFNVAALWFMSFVFYIMLVFDLLRWIITYFDSERLRRKNNS